MRRYRKRPRKDRAAEAPSVLVRRGAREDVTITRTRPWGPGRSAAVFVCIAVCFIVGIPTRAQGQVAIETCEDWAAGAPVRCRAAFPQGVPWLVYVFRGYPLDDTLFSVIARRSRERPPLWPLWPGAIPWRITR